jgi:DNA primase
MSLTPQWLDELRSRISLSGVIGRSIRVQKAGREFKACCPFHNERRPASRSTTRRASTTASAAARMAM